MSDKARTGTSGENLAADYFRQHGFDVVARNYRYRKGEIDLIVQRGNWLVFVEVKTRHSDAFGMPETFVSDRQRRKIFEVAEEFIYSRDWKGHIRFDIVSVMWGESPKIEHFEDAIS